MATIKQLTRLGERAGLTDWLAGWLSGWLAGWLANWPVYLLLMTHSLHAVTPGGQEVSLELNVVRPCKHND